MDPDEVCSHDWQDGNSCEVCASELEVLKGLVGKRRIAPEDPPKLSSIFPRELADKLGIKIPDSCQRINRCLDCQRELGVRANPFLLTICEQCREVSRQARIDESLNAAIERLPEAYRSCRFATEALRTRIQGPDGQLKPSLKMAYEYLYQWTPKTNESVFFAGTNQLGKTSIVVATLIRLIDRARQSRNAIAVGIGSKVEFVPAVDLCNSRGEEFMALLRRAKRASVLVLDDLGAEQCPYVLWQSRLYELLSGRLNANRHTLITTNLSVRQTRELYGPTVGSRLETRFRLLEALS
jgi:DNA replication protein DnaC